MVILDLDTELAHSTRRRPFTNGVQGIVWMDSWCSQCVHESGPDTCLLLQVAFSGRTPDAWTDISLNHLDRYICAEWTPTGNPLVGLVE